MTKHAAASFKTTNTWSWQRTLFFNNSNSASCKIEFVLCDQSWISRCGWKTHTPAKHDQQFQFGFRLLWTTLLNYTENTPTRLPPPLPPWHVERVVHPTRLVLHPPPPESELNFEKCLGSLQRDQSKDAKWKCLNQGSVAVGRRDGSGYGESRSMGSHSWSIWLVFSSGASWDGIPQYRQSGGRTYSFQTFSVLERVEGWNSTNGGVLLAKKEALKECEDRWWWYRMPWQRRWGR